MKKIVLLSLILFYQQRITAQSLEELPLSTSWITALEANAPSKTTIPTVTKKKILLFSLHTGFNHWVIPHTDEVIKALAKKTGAFEVVMSRDIKSFLPENLKQYDAVVLNNTCSKGENRNIFLDVYLEDNSLTTREQLKKADEMEKGLMDYIANGGGLMILHGGIVMQNKSPKFGEMVGASFDYHPIQQSIDVKLVDPKHPLVAAFEGQGFTHYDEPYIFNNAYFDYNFRPLLSMETSKISKLRKEATDKVKYISWIKRFGKGRVFYSSPSHNAQSYDNPKLLKFLLDAMQYVVGDLPCDDSPIGKH